MRIAPLLGIVLATAACGSRPSARSASAEAPAAPQVAAAAPAAIATAAPSAPLADPPPKRYPLADDAQWQAKLDRWLAAEIPRGQAERTQWLQVEEWLAWKARDYARAETADRELLADSPNDPLLLASLSVQLGKQGRYAEALAAVDRALAQPEVHAMHAHAVRASWLWHLGRRDEARAEFAAIPAPARADEDWSLYQGCRACFAASAHEMPMLQDSIRELAQLGGEDLDFARRDVIFDQYRAEPWFVELVGETLAPEM